MLEDFYVLGYKTIVRWELTDVSEEHVATMLVSCLYYSSTLKIKPVCCSAMSVYFQLNTRRCISEIRTPCNHSCESHKSYTCKGDISVGSCEDSNEPSNSIKGGTGWPFVNFPRTLFCWVIYTEECCYSAFTDEESNNTAHCDDNRALWRKGSVPRQFQALTLIKRGKMWKGFLEITDLEILFPTEI
jgi:hypothetical protein